MSLDYRLGKIKNHEELLDSEKKPNALLTAATFMCMGIQLGEITEQNWHEWYRRAWLWEAVHGPMRTSDFKQPVYFTEEDVQRLVGLQTNVFPAASKVKFKAHMGEIALEQFASKRARDQKEEVPRG
jgi:hypothetical protein